MTVRIGNNTREWSSKEFSPESPKYTEVGSKRCFGVELEFNTLSDNATDVEAISTFGAKYDCTVRGGEFYSPILFGDEGLTEVDKLCDFAVNNDWEAGRTAGYHLHLDMRGETIDQLKTIALGYHYTKAFWLGSVPSYRRSNEYSHNTRWGRSDLMSVRDKWDLREMSDTRYNWLNTYAYEDHQTFEVRCHEGVEAAFPVVAWVIAHTRFADAMSELSVGKITRMFGRKKPNEIFREIRAILREPAVSEHLRDRYNQFSN